MARIGFGSPADHESLDDGLRLVDLALRHHRYACPARRLSDVRKHHDRGAREIVPRLLVVDVVQRPQAPGWREHRDRTLDIDPDVARVHRDGEGLGRRQPGVELVVDEKSPDVAERHPADKILDVDAPIAQRAPFLVRLGDLGLESDYTLESGLEVGLSHRRLLCKIKQFATAPVARTELSTSRPGPFLTLSWAAAHRSWQGERFCSAEGPPIASAVTRDHDARRGR